MKFYSFIITLICSLIFFSCESKESDVSLSDASSLDSSAPSTEASSKIREFSNEKSDSVKKEATIDFQNLINTDSGLQYMDLVLGDGETPNKGDKIEVHYTGTLEDGTKFDSSLDRDRPFTFTLGVGQVIKGWDEGLATMKIGGKRKLVIPSELGYGSRATGKIPANSVLIFEVELLNVVKAFKDSDFDLPGREVLTDSGIRMIVHKEGSGVTPKKGQTVKVHYTLILENAERIQSTHDRGKPFEFQVGEGKVIKGWDESLMLMKKGAKNTVIVPPELGYGERQLGPIPSNSILIFEIELVDFN